ncbi:MAG: hypothetical protein H0T48_09190 [Gemmatimonadaceae bacterium]|nr:hypothetical protein [Gemmatimonadaceae bacterium]
MKRTVSVLGIAFIGMAGCATPSQPGSESDVAAAVNVRVGDQFDLPVGTSARIGGTGIILRFRGIEEDSRCPIDVQCVWAGNAAASMTLSASGIPSRDERINTTVDPRSTLFHGHEVRLVGLKPAPRSGIAIRPAAYVGTFEVAPK